MTCPNCRSDLRFELMRAPLQCPFCGEPIQFSLIHRLVTASLGLFIALLGTGLFEELGLKGLVLPLLLLALYFPGLVLAHGLLLFLNPPTYVRRQPTVTTLFRRQQMLNRASPSNRARQKLRGRV